MKTFQEYLDTTKEVGFIERVHRSMVYVKGLPNVRPGEIVLFETGQSGQVISLSAEHVEVLLFTDPDVSVGTKVARTNENLQIRVGKELLGLTITPLGKPITPKAYKKPSEARLIDITPPSMVNRKNITRQLETGVSWVDLVVPLGKGQRELIVGDRKIGKTEFLLQVMQSAASQGLICVYAAIAKRKLDIMRAEEFVAEKNLTKHTIIVSSSASDPAGLIFVAPYTAMTIAEYFRDQGADVLLILDDMTAHAKYYREITLLARRFPGRSSYPGDIFYVQSRLLERGGNFIVKGKEVSITCLPVAELVMGDMSGYIQTNLMAVTDGHILFDRDLYNQGRRPAINPFLSVTRVGHQTQSPLQRDLSLELTSFLVHLESLREFMHFGAELSEATKRTLSLGDQVLALLEQGNDTIIPLSINSALLAAIWAGVWKNTKLSDLKVALKEIIAAHSINKTFSGQVDNLVTSQKTFDSLVQAVKEDQDLLLNIIKK